MRKLTYLLLGIFLAVGAVAGQENHGATLTWVASTSQASCISTSNPPCAWSYSVLEGSAGNETTKLNTSPLTVLTLTDDGPTLNAYLGTTRCYVIQFQEVVGGMTQTANSAETCVAFPAILSGPGTVVITMH